MASLLVIGDSLSAPIQVGTESALPWPRLAFGDDALNLALGGSSLEHWAGWTWWHDQVDPGATIYLLIGTNDAISGSWPSYSENLDGLLTAAFASGAGRVRILHSPRIYDPAYQHLNPIIEAERSAELGACARWAAVRCGPDLYAALDDPVYFADGIHLGDLGHQAVASLVLPEPSTLVLLLLGLALLSRLWPRSAGFSDS